MRSTFLLLAAVLAFAAAPAHAADTPNPNVVFILIDDLGWRDLACYGSTFYETPNIASSPPRACGSPTPTPLARSARQPGPAS